MAAGQFRSSSWDPILLIAQMVTMQSLFYVGLGACTILVDFITGAERGCGLWYVVQRTKLCWDFAGTVYLFHVVACWAVNGQLSSSPFWWLLIFISAVVMTVLGEYLCMRTELKAIPLSGSAARVEL